MNAIAEDQCWLREFATSGSETAFRALAGRHHGMVYGTALRIARENPAAEEIAQNVLVALARKAPFLPRDLCVGAWLHRCAVLEAKRWVRGEMRRREREAKAGDYMSENDESLLRALAPALDHAMLDLPERDRAALLLRFYQEQNLDQVGAALGISADTAQKRVGKAIRLLMRAFRKRGYLVPAAAIVTELLQRAAPAAPAGLCANAATAALTAAAPASLGGALPALAKFMSLTKFQTAAVCVLLAAGPAGWQWRQARDFAAKGERLERTRALEAATLASLESRHTGLMADLSAGRSVLLANQAELNQWNALTKPALPPPEELYRWSSDSEFVRLPKGILNGLRLTPPREFHVPGESETRVASGEIVDADGRVSPVLLEALGLDAAQAGAVQDAFMGFAAEFRALQRSRGYLTNSMPPGVGFQVPPGERLFTLHTPAFPEEGAQLKSRLEEAVRGSIGPERAEILLERQARNDLRGTFRDFGKQGDWLAAARQAGGMFSVARSLTFEGASYNASVNTVSHEQLPDELKAYFDPQHQN